MPDIALDLRYLKYALLAAEHGSFRRTAEILSVSQSTVSRRIQILERRVGIALFERHRSGARATLAGERFLKEAAVGAKHLHQAVNTIAQAKRGSTGVLHVGLAACLTNGFLAELFAAYHRRFPAIEVNFEEGTSQVSTGAVLSGRLDIAFMLADPRVPGCRTERMWDERIYVAVPSSHEFASLDAVALADVNHETFLVMADAAGPDIENYLVRKLSISGVRPLISTQHIGCENVLNMVSQGFGIAIATNSAVGTAYPGVNFVPIKSDEESFSFSAVWATTNQNPALKLLIDLSLEVRMKTGR
ncbi:LysR family transcriptional regulator [Tistrella mobilis]|uniref:LysR family transcriptional regulator n=1 Tax=Tistrella mobilis TaxID=171437 RepID=UPI003555DDF7